MTYTEVFLTQFGEFIQWYIIYVDSNISSRGFFSFFA